MYERQDYAVDLPDRDRVDFWQCDALALPFAPGIAGLVTSLNLLDCLSAPMDHLAWIARLLGPEGRALLATPYDWSAQATPVEHWLGGHSQRGPESGSSEAILARALPMVGLRCEQQIPSVDWTVRLHDRARVVYSAHLALLAREAPPEPTTAAASE